MQSYYRVACRPENRGWGVVGAHDVPIDRGQGFWIALIPTDHARVSEMLEALGKVPMSIVNEFTKREIASAEWLKVSAKGRIGDPMPQNGWDLRTYDPATYCRKCGMGLTQRLPFRISKEPGEGRWQFLFLNGVYDELFVRTAARDGLIAAGLTGFDFAPPLIHRNGLPSLTVDQMRIHTVLPPVIDTSELQPVTCIPFNEESHVTLRPSPDYVPSTVFCGREKHHLQRIGPLRIRRPALEGAPDVVKSAEYFGSGGLAFQLIIVSQRFRALAEKSNWRGLAYEPLELV